MQHPSTQPSYTDGYRDRMNGQEHAPTNEPNYELGWRDADHRVKMLEASDPKLFQTTK